MPIVTAEDSLQRSSKQASSTNSTKLLLIQAVLIGASSHSSMAWATLIRVMRPLSNQCAQTMLRASSTRITLFWLILGAPTGDCCQVWYRHFFTRNKIDSQGHVEQQPMRAAGMERGVTA